MLVVCGGVATIRLCDDSGVKTPCGRGVTFATDGELISTAMLAKEGVYGEGGGEEGEGRGG